MDNPDHKFVCTVWDQLYKEAAAAVKREPLLKPLIDEAVLRHNSFADSLRFRLATKLGGRLVHSNDWIKVFEEASNGNQDYAIMRDACHDLIAILKRDPACDSVLTAFLFFKGYKALQSYRFSHIFWIAGRKELALLLQSRISEVFSVDIHPGARLGRGVMLDHATGLVIGETSVVGDDCSFLHGVTLGGTGKVSGDRHPKIGNNVVIGCNASVLGNITIGDNCKIGSGTIVVKPMLPGTTAVGTPARIIEPKETSVDTPSHHSHHHHTHNFSSPIRRHFSSTSSSVKPLQNPIKTLFNNKNNRIKFMSDLPFRYPKIFNKTKREFQFDKSFSVYESGRIFSLSSTVFAGVGFQRQSVYRLMYLIR